MRLASLQLLISETELLCLPEGCLASYFVGFQGEKKHKTLFIKSKLCLYYLVSEAISERYPSSLLLPFAALVSISIIHIRKSSIEI